LIGSWGGKKSVIGTFLKHKVSGNVRNAVGQQRFQKNEGHTRNSMKQTTDQKLDVLVGLMEKIIANPVAPVAPVAPVLPIAPLTTTSTEDHVAIATLVVSVAAMDTKFSDKFADIKNDIKGLSDGTATQLADHETRIRTVEQYQQNLVGKMSIIVAGVSLAVSIFFLWVGNKLGL
jgi:hypothetical protein